MSNHKIIIALQIEFNKILLLINTPLAYHGKALLAYHGRALFLGSNFARFLLATSRSPGWHTAGVGCCLRPVLQILPTDSVPRQAAEMISRLNGYTDNHLLSREKTLPLPQSTQTKKSKYIVLVAAMLMESICGAHQYAPGVSGPGENGKSGKEGLPGPHT